MTFWMNNIVLMTHNQHSLLGFVHRSCVSCDTFNTENHGRENFSNNGRLKAMKPHNLSALQLYWRQEHNRTLGDH